MLQKTPIQGLLMLPKYLKEIKMKTLKVLWWAVVVISLIWVIISIVSSINFALINTYEVIHAKRFFGETAEILKKEKEVSGLMKQNIILSITNVFVITVGIITIKKMK